MVHTLPDLPYAYNALEPYICTEIMELHHGAHHKTYVNNLNAAEDKLREAIAANDIKKIIELQSAIKFNGGGHLNHTLFWENMASEESGGGRLSPGKLKDLIERDFKSVDDMKKQVNAAAMALQGSGWVWLGINVGNKRLGIATTPNQDTLVDLVPLIAIDLWEHSFYIQYKNKKVDYLTNIWHVINFQTAEQRLRSVLEHL